MIRDLRSGAPGTFLTVWNGLAADVWSVLFGVFEDDAVAAGWATTFRLELALRVAGFVLDQPLSVQVGRVLLDHVGASLPRSGTPLPPSPQSTPDETLRTLPQAARLRYLVDLFFHVELAGPGADDLALLRLMEPGQHTDARRTAQSLLQRVPPDEVLLYPPGAAPVPPPPPSRRVFQGAAVLIAVLGLLAFGISFRPHRIDWLTAAARHAELTSPGSDEVTVGFDPTELSLALIRAGARVTLVEIPDLEPEQLRLIGGVDLERGTDDETVMAVYTAASGSETSLYTLQHTGATLPDDATGPGGEVADHVHGDLDVAGWTEPGGSWILCGTGRSVGALATRIRDRRAGGRDGAP